MGCSSIHSVLQLHRIFGLEGLFPQQSFHPFILRGTGGENAGGLRLKTENEDGGS